MIFMMGNITWMSVTWILGFYPFWKLGSGLHDPGVLILNVKQHGTG